MVKQKKGKINKIEKLLKEMIKENMFGEKDVPEARTILTWMHNGRKAAEKISKKAVKNLIENGYVDKSGEKLCCGEDDEEMSIWFCLAICGAKGFIKQVEGKGVKVTKKVTKKKKDGKKRKKSK